jgi:hypothetical protein
MKENNRFEGTGEGTLWHWASSKQGEHHKSNRASKNTNNFFLNCQYRQDITHKLQCLSFKTLLFLKKAKQQKTVKPRDTHRFIHKLNRRQHFLRLKQKPKQESPQH